MKSASLAFLLLLIVAHALGDTGQLLARPLSELRDGRHPAVGYALFGLLGVVAALMYAASFRARREVEVLVFGVAAALLAVVAVTSSTGALHNLCAFLLLGLLYAYFALLLYASGSPLLYLYVPVPLVLLLTTGFHSYGLWQKSVIVYLLVLINVHYHLTSRPPSAPATPRKQPGGRRDPMDKRRVVYALGGGAAWRRRDTRNQLT